MSDCGPTRLLKPYSVTIARAMRVALVRSWLAPVVTLSPPKMSSSATRPPMHTSSIASSCRRVMLLSSLSGSCNTRLHAQRVWYAQSVRCAVPRAVLRAGTWLPHRDRTAAVACTRYIIIQGIRRRCQDTRKTKRHSNTKSSGCCAPDTQPYAACNAIKHRHHLTSQQSLRSQHTQAHANRRSTKHMPIIPDLPHAHPHPKKQSLSCNCGGAAPA